MSYVRTTLNPARNGRPATITVTDLRSRRQRTFRIDRTATNKHVAAAESFTGSRVRFDRETYTGRGNIYRTLNV